MRRCAKGHCFDDDKLIYCPECGLPMAANKTQTVNQTEEQEKTGFQGIYDNQSSELHKTEKTEKDESPSKAFVWGTLVFFFACIIFIILGVASGSQFFISIQPKNIVITDVNEDDLPVLGIDSRHGIPALRELDGLRIIDSSNYIIGALKGQLFDAHFVPDTIDKLSYFPSGLLEMWDYIDDLFFEKQQNGQTVTVQTNVGDLLAGDGMFSCLCSLRGQNKQVDASKIDPITFRYVLPEGAIEKLHWWYYTTYGEKNENNENEISSMIYFNILDGKITEATITLSNQAISIYFKSLCGQYNEINFAKSGTELNLKYDISSGKLLTATGFKK